MSDPTEDALADVSEQASLWLEEADRQRFRADRLEAENARLREANAGLASEALNRRHAEAAEAEVARLRIALHDAIRRPLGVVPESAVEFYSYTMAEQAEEWRPRITSAKPNDAPA
jgi:hypothetical protein